MEIDHLRHGAGGHERGNYRRTEEEFSFHIWYFVLGLINTVRGKRPVCKAAMATRAKLAPARVQRPTTSR
jgi:hypothetical protein